MLISYNWLQTYFDKPLPDPEKITELLTLHSFEVESIEKVASDFVFDIKVLPDRAHDCLSHRGIAREISVLTATPLNRARNSKHLYPESNVAKIEVEDAKLCPRFSLLVIENVVIKESPSWLKERLESIGQKSINNIVDITNFVMFDMGQPLHAYDLEKLTGAPNGISLGVRFSNGNERLQALDGKDYPLKEENIVIYDANARDKKALGVAGVKGGLASKIDEKTRNIVIEAANFNPVSVRISSKNLELRTDASIRFENGMSPELTTEALFKAADLAMEIASSADTRVEGLADFYPRKASPYKVGFSLTEVRKILGIEVNQKEIEVILLKGGFEFKYINPRDLIVKLAPQFIGTPYKYGSSVLYDAPNFFDCSSFTSFLYKEVGIAIPRMSADQFVFGEEISRAELKAGDLVFSNSGNGKIHYESTEWLKGTPIHGGVDHVGIYMADGLVLHATQYAEAVVEENLNESKSYKNIIGFRKVKTLDENRFVVTIPSVRLDLRIKEDLIEEIGRIYGYENIPSQKVAKSQVDPEINKISYYCDLIRSILNKRGFSEVYNYPLVSEGEVEILNPLSRDKAHLRKNLVEGLQDSLRLALVNAPLLGLKIIKIFEIGKVFDTSEEYLSLGLVVKNTNEYKGKVEREEVLELKSELEKQLQMKLEFKNSGEVYHINLESVINNLSEPSEPLKYLIDDSKFFYKEISSYPFILRDIAVFVPMGTKAIELQKLIKQQSGNLLVNIYLFDEFKKDDQVSYAHRLVFQSNEKTLTDEEVNIIVENITQSIKNSGWVVR